MQGLGAIGRQASAGTVVGLSAVIYSLSYGALLFAGPLTPFVGYGITVALISAAFGALFGAFSEEKTFVAGPDSNTISVLANILAVSGALGLAGMAGVNSGIAMIFLTSLLSALAFYLVARADLSELVRYIPFPVMAGFLTSTGWLMASGAMNIIAGTPFSLAGLHAFLADPLRPQLGLGLLIVAGLYVLARWLSSALLIPVVMVLAALIVNAALAGTTCAAAICQREAWLFPKIAALQWMPPWQLDWGQLDLALLIHSLPGMLVVAFVGLLTILLSVASLELNFQREFDLNGVLRTHAMAGGLAALAGGFIPIISIGRTTVSRQTGGGTVSGLIAAAICLAMLLGAGDVVAYIPRAALGALVLYLGLNLMKQWLWDNRASTSRFELAQILLILALVAGFGFMVGFAAGVLISCIAFIVTYSRIPLTDLAANVALLPSSAVRPIGEVEILRRHGEKVLVYRLSGYVFFGSARKIAHVFNSVKTEGDDAVEGIILDFTNVSGIDSSAISIFRRLLGRFQHLPVRFYFVHSAATETAVGRMVRSGDADGQIHLFGSLDRAIEQAEQHIIAGSGADAGSVPASYFDDAAAQALFFGYCERRPLRAGEFLCRENERSDALFFIDDGGFEVIKDAGEGNPIRLAKLYQGAMVGELAFYSGEVRSASIVATVDSHVHVMSRLAFARLRQAHPDLATRFDHLVIDKLSKTLVRTNTLLTLFR